MAGNSWLWWIIIGLVAGALAKFIMPGRDPGGIIVTIILGIIGAFVGGWLATNVLGIGVGSTFGSIIVATIGAILLLVIYRMATGGRRTV